MNALETVWIGVHLRSSAAICDTIQGLVMPKSKPYLPLLLALFVGSGCAALIYEVVWFQSLQLVIGSSALSLGVLLGTYMGGMCLGSWLLPRFVKRNVHPLRVYSMIELGIGVCAILALIGVPLVNNVYAA